MNGFGLGRMPELWYNEKEVRLVEDKERNMETIALFVDGASMFYAQRDNGWHIDFKDVYQYFTINREVAGAWYFTATPPRAERDRFERYRRFRSALIHIGYSVVDKEVRTITDRNSGITKLKGNLDIELVFRMLSTIDKYECAVLLGGDSDYVPVIDHLVNSGKKVVIVGRRQSTATDLINSASEFIDLEDLRDHIEKR